MQGNVITHSYDVLLELQMTTEVDCMCLLQELMMVSLHSQHILATERSTRRTRTPSSGISSSHFEDMLTDLSEEYVVPDF